jgi:hypothetical protein
MEFITLQEVKDFESIRSPEGDVHLQTLVDGVNSQITTILDADQLETHVDKPSISPVLILLDTDALASQIVVTDLLDNPLIGLSGLKGQYWFSNEEYVGLLKITIPNRFATIPLDLKMAAAYLVRYYRKDEYKASVSGAGQAVSFVSLASNLPKHVLTVLSLYRPI